MNLLRKYIREALSFLYEKQVLPEPDTYGGSEKEEAVMLSGSPIAGVTSPLGDEEVSSEKSKKKSKKKSDISSSSFGGGTYKD